MEDGPGSQAELIEELDRLRRAVAALEKSQAQSESERERLWQSQTRYEALVELAPDIIYCLDPDGKILFISRAVEALGYELDELLGRPFDLIVHPEDAGRERNRFIERRTGARAVRNIEVRLLTRKHGSRDHWLKDVAVTISARGLWNVPNHEIKRPDRRFLGTLGIARDITERRAIENELQTALQEKEILLLDTHHRVKNNLQLVSSLLSLQFETSKDKRGLDVLRESQDRIEAMALVHDQLYGSGDLVSIDMGRYTRSLVDHLSRSFGTPSVSHEVDAESVSLDLDAAIPCGLILNELWTNAVKYAFPGGRSGIISVSLRPSGPDDIELVVRDDGVGLPEDVDLENADTLGLRLVHLLVRQLKGDVRIDRMGGTTFRIIFPREKEKRPTHVKPEDPDR